MTCTARTPARAAESVPLLAGETEAAWSEDRDLLEGFLSGVVDDPRAVAERLLAWFGGLGSVVAADASELARAAGAVTGVPGRLRLARDLAARLAREKACRRPVISSSEALRVYVHTAMAHRPREQFRALFLDRRNTLMRDEMIAEGTIDHAPVYPREVVRRALEMSAAAIILVHNHPSGDPEPSRADIEMTRKIVEASKLFDIQVHDHLVVGRFGFASLRALGHFR